MLANLVVCISVLGWICAAAQTTCKPGTYLSGSVCTAASIGTYVPSLGATGTITCSSSLYEGSATCQETEAYVTTFAGGGSDTDGYGTNANMNLPVYAAMDTLGVMYITDLADRSVRRLDTSDTLLTTLAGNGNLSPGFVDGIGTNALFAGPYWVAVDSNRNIYVTDQSNKAIRKMTTAAEVTTFYADSTLFGCCLMGVAVDTSANVYVTSYAKCSVLSFSPDGSLLWTIGGQGCSISSSDGVGTNAMFYSPLSITVSTSGIVYVADYTAIRKIDATTGEVTTYAGTKNLMGNIDGPADSALFSWILGLSIDTEGVLFVADENHLVKTVSTVGIVTTIAGQSAGLINGFGTNAEFNFPYNVATSTTTTHYVVDETNKVIRALALGGYCPAGQYATTPSTTSCSAAPAGYYKPLAEFSDNYYICEPGTYSTRGSSSCTSCDSATTFGATSCPPTTAPSSVPTHLPTPARGFLGFDYGKSAALTLTDMNCFKDNGLSFFLPRGFVTWNTPTRGVESVTDPYICRHLELADKADLTIKGIYIQARNRFGLQHDAAILSLKAHLMKRCADHVDTPVWLVVSTAGSFGGNNGWLDSTQRNRVWFEKLLRTCKQYFKSCGVMSNKAAWTTVFGTSYLHNSTVYKDVPLWYSVSSGSPNFGDFGSAKFGGWGRATLKQYQTGVDVCGRSVGLDWMQG